MSGWCAGNTINVRAISSPVRYPVRVGGNFRGAGSPRQIPEDRIIVVVVDRQLVTHAAQFRMIYRADFYQIIDLET